MKRIRRFATVLGMVASACGGKTVLSTTHVVKFDIGGAVVYKFDPTEPLANVLVTVSNVDGVAVAATTGSAGLWTIRDLAPGVYSERYEKAGYEPFTDTFALDANAQINASNPFVTLPAVELEETKLQSATSPFGVTVADGSDLRDGVGGATLVYSLSGGAAIQLVFSRRLLGGYAVINDTTTGALIAATVDTASGATMSFSKLQIDSMNGGGGLATDTDPYTWQEIHVSVSSFTPIHGDLESMQASLEFNAIP